MFLLRTVTQFHKKKWFLHNFTSRVTSTYAPLSAKLVDLAPEKVKPFLILSRCHSPAPTWLLYWPCCWSIASAADPGCLPDMATLLLFGVGSVLMRGAGCTINDIMDRDIDSKVRRTMSRPLVTGLLTIPQAYAHLLVQLSLALIVLLQFNWYTIFLGSSSLILMFTYPLMKRVTNWPQIVLGMTVNYGALLGYSAICGYVDFKICAPLYVAALAWTTLYDTMYALQDREDDSKIGVKSTALLFGDNTKKLLYPLSGLVVSNLLVSGVFNEQSAPYFISVGVVSILFARQIYTLNIHSSDDCIKKFRSNVSLGLIIFLGTVFGTLLKKAEDNSV